MALAGEDYSNSLALAYFSAQAGFLLIHLNLNLKIVYGHLLQPSEDGLEGRSGKTQTSRTVPGGWEIGLQGKNVLEDGAGVFDRLACLGADGSLSPKKTGIAS